MKKGLITFAIVLVLALGGFYLVRQSSTPGYWTLDGAASTLNFGSIKNGYIAEVHSLPGLSGGADATGQFSVSLDLASVSTGVDTRDQRMRELLFETAKFPAAVVTGVFNPADFENLKVGERKALTLPITLSLHGVEQTREIEIFAVRLAWNRMLVASAEPVMIEAADFDLAEGIEKLREAAGLDSIAGASPVTFVLVFDGTATPGGK
jgi:polyisoprenoid-binding protein YceI